MDEKLLKGLGISAAVIGVVFLVGISFVAYKNFYDLQRTKLEILRLQKELGLPMDNDLIGNSIEKIFNKKK